MDKRYSQKKKLNQGFSLIELLVVLVIIGVLGMWVGPKFIGKIDEAKITETRSQMEGLETALKMYRIHNGVYPTTAQGLQALVQKPDSGVKKWQKGGYLDKGKVPKDAWGNEFVYLSPGVHGDFDITSYGKDGVPGGEDDNKDINNWEEE